MNLIKIEDKDKFLKKNNYLGLFYFTSHVGMIFFLFFLILDNSNIRRCNKFCKFFINLFLIIIYLLKELILLVKGSRDVYFVMLSTSL
jgi:hypothetical protein